MKLATTLQLARMDCRSSEEFHVPGLVLMENAALRVVEILAARFSPLLSRPIALVCGTGKNGGDGLAIARHLAGRFGAKVTVWLASDPSRFQGDAAVSYQMAKAYGVTIRPVSEMTLSGAEMIIDALFGTGLRGPVIGDSAKVINDVNLCGKPIISVDVPSGLEADTGKAEGAVIRASLTVTFAYAKFGLLDYPGAGYVGELIVADIGMPPDAVMSADITAYATSAADVGKWFPTRVNNRDSNKGGFGHVLVLAGSAAFPGAPVLVAEAAARSGAGLVTLAVPESLRLAVVAHISPVVVTRGIPQCGEGTFGPSSLAAALELAGHANAVALGPGVGTGDEAGKFIKEFTARCPVPLVLDADGLTVLSQEPDQGASIIRSRTAPTALTPHPGEMSRLLKSDIHGVQQDRRLAVSLAAAKFKCIAVLKGSRTLSTRPDGKLFLNTTGNPGMASGGSGDALSGVIAALLAQHLEPLNAAAAGAYIHGLAGDLAASSQEGTICLLATDLIEMLPRAIARCQALQAETK